MKSILVTGAYGGMGSAACKLLRDMGYTVFALDKRVSEAENGIIPIQADITSEDSVKAAFASIGETTDGFTALPVICFAVR